MLCMVLEASKPKCGLPGLPNCAEEEQEQRQAREGELSEHARRAGVCWAKCEAEARRSTRKFSLRFSQFPLLRCFTTSNVRCRGELSTAGIPIL